MKTRLLFLLLLIHAYRSSAATPQGQSRAFDGVVATFVLETPSIRAGQALKLRYTFHNTSDHFVNFRYGALLEHVRVFDSSGRELPLVYGAPIWESPASEIPLKPGEIFRNSERLDLTGYYEMPLGSYYLQLYYDLRLLPNSVSAQYKKQLHSKDWVVWDNHKYHFTVSRYGGGVRVLKLTAGFLDYDGDRSSAYFR